MALPTKITLVIFAVMLMGKVTVVRSQYRIEGSKLIGDFRRRNLNEPPQAVNTSVDVLILSENELIFFNFTADMNDLQKIALDYNGLEEFPDLHRAPKLKEVDLSHNSIQVINPKRLEAISLLEDLKLTGNSLTSFPDTSEPLPAPKSLLLDENHFTAIPRLVNFSSSMMLLAMDSNDLATIRVNDLLGYPDLRSLYASHNPLLKVIDNFCTTPGSEKLHKPLLIAILHSSVSCDSGLAWGELWTAPLSTSCSASMSSLAFPDNKLKVRYAEWTQIDFTKFFCTIPKVTKQLSVYSEASCAFHCLSTPNCIVFGLNDPDPRGKQVGCVMTGDDVDNGYSAHAEHPQVTRWFIVESILH